MKIGHIPERLEQVLVPRYQLPPHTPPQLKPGGLTPSLPGCSTTVSPPICPCLSGWLAGCVSGCPPPPPGLEVGGGCAEWLRCAWGGGANAAGPPNAQLGALMSGFPLHFCTGLRCFPWERGEWGKAPLRGGTKGVARPTATHPTATHPSTVHPSATHPGTASPPSHLPLKSRLCVLPDPNLVGFTPDGAQGTGNISTPWCRGAPAPQHPTSQCPSITHPSIPHLDLPASHISHPIIPALHNPTSHIPTSWHCTSHIQMPWHCVSHIPVPPHCTSQHPTPQCPGTAHPTP